ncbi:MAG: BON domain-containing protein [Nitrospirae bacterium]|nr:BON domain-containing protein [Nitrospirota bacterium]MBI3392335.1 BON domain-containing protein [Nitrospirota bacterium]
MGKRVIAGAFVLLLALAACAGTPERRSTGEVIDDVGLAARVRSVLAADPLVSSLRISVEVSRGLVSVTGTVGTAREKERILEDVRAVPGVKGVNDLLAAPSPQP